MPKYAKALNEIAARKQINLNFRHNLIEIDSANRSAIFEHLDRHDHISFNVSTCAVLTFVIDCQTFSFCFLFQYDFLHVTPPQKPSPILAPLANEAGFVDVDKYTLQHVRYPNVFSLGDCSSLPTSKTAAAVAAEGNVLYQNLISQINHKPLTFKVGHFKLNYTFDLSSLKRFVYLLPMLLNRFVLFQYDGYTSCPLLTGQQKCILAEFDYDLQPKETLPFDQSKERRLAFWLKKDVIPFIYWNFMVK